jgi:hypothetical protein
MVAMATRDNPLAALGSLLTTGTTTSSGGGGNIQALQQQYGNMLPGTTAAGMQALIQQLFQLGQQTNMPGITSAALGAGMSPGNSSQAMQMQNDLNARLAGQAQQALLSQQQAAANVGAQIAANTKMPTVQSTKTGVNTGNAAALAALTAGAQLASKVGLLPGATDTAAQTAAQTAATAASTGGINPLPLGGTTNAMQADTGLQSSLPWANDLAALISSNGNFGQAGNAIATSGALGMIPGYAGAAALNGLLSAVGINDLQQPMSALNQGVSGMVSGATGAAKDLANSAPQLATDVLTNAPSIASSTISGVGSGLSQMAADLGNLLGLW